MISVFDVTWNGEQRATFDYFTEAEAYAHQLEQEYDSVFVADEYRCEMMGDLTLTIRSEQRGFGTQIKVKRRSW